MDNFVELFNQYARSELLILVPVLTIISRILVARNVTPRNSSLLITGASILLCGLYTFSKVPIESAANISMALFTSITQGILYSGASVLGEVVFNSNCVLSMLTGKPCTTTEAEPDATDDTEQSAEKPDSQ